MAARRRTIHERAREAIRAAALAYPDTTEEFPWGESVVKVRGKVFVFLGSGVENGFGCSVKLPESCHAALTLPFATPTGYGLGKSGWITARFSLDEDIPVPLLLEWLAESHAAVAPKVRANAKATAKATRATKATKATAKKPAAKPKRRART